jgi:2-keto-4-pentenoate hydratase/2-oxohepta-3-ene-1,7-dioic acid hydratase in catechol pathway
MKLVTFARDGIDSIGALLPDDVQALDLQAAHRRRTGAALPAFASMQALIEAGERGLAAARAALAEFDPRDSVALGGAAHLRAPLPLPMQIRDCLCFEQHLVDSAEAAARLTGQPISDRHRAMHDAFKARPIYYKANRFATTGPDTTITWPTYSRMMDYELEMACIIGTGGKNISRDAASSHIFGFTIFNDLSARDTQGPEMASGLGPSKSKDFDGANVFGPCIVTADSFDPYNARMTVRINGEQRSSGSSSTMDYHFEDLISFISRDETLHPGEILCSGTVGGGCGLEAGRLLTHGDTIELEIQGIGVLRNHIVTAA